MILDTLLEEPQYARPQADKTALLLPELIRLTQWHQERCPSYARILALQAPRFADAKRLEDLPYLPVGLFKTHHLASVPDDNLKLTLTSSGTSGRLSRIPVDAVTARNQARGFAAVMREALGAERLPLLLVDSETSLSGGLNARGAGLLGMMLLGRAPVFALDNGMQVNRHAVGDFLAKHGDKPFLIFGFTAPVWVFFTQQAGAAFDWSHAILIHGGGWKKLADQAVSPKAFRARLAAYGLQRMYNYYGMVEQTGTALLEGADGLLYPPAFGDVIIRDPRSWEALPAGTEGVVQMLSLLPHSYPGHSVLTEDLGMIVTIDAGAGGRMGKAVRITGRAPKAELRGCSDVYARIA